MGIRNFSIEYDQDTFYSGYEVSGRVNVTIHGEEEVKGIELTLRGKAKCYWDEKVITITDTTKLLPLEQKEKSFNNKEIYLAKKLNLTESKGSPMFVLPDGDHVFEFSHELPVNSPPTYRDEHSRITYHGKAKMHLWMGSVISKKERFLVENPIDLNLMPELKQPFRLEEDKLFCCLWCANGPLIVSVFVPRTGFIETEVIPITVDVDNRSYVEVSNVRIQLNKRTNWKAKKGTKEENAILMKHKLGSVGKKTFVRWSKNIGLIRHKYLNTGSSSIIRIHYELVVELDARGPHLNFRVKVPLTIGTIPYSGSSAPESTYVRSITNRELAEDLILDEYENRKR